MLDSAEGKGMHLLGVSGVTFVPLSTIVGVAEAKKLVELQKEKIHAQIKSGNLSKGLQAQYKVQLDKLESGKNGDCEIIFFPGSMLPNCTLQLFLCDEFMICFCLAVIQEGRSCVTIISAINLPFSRGTVVS